MKRTLTKDQARELARTLEDFADTVDNAALITVELSTVADGPYHRDAVKVSFGSLVEHVRTYS